MRQAAWACQGQAPRLLLIASPNGWWGPSIFQRRTSRVYIYFVDSQEMTGANIVQRYLDNHYRIVLWKAEGSSKGPKEKDWPTKTYTAGQYKEDTHRVGLLLGIEVEPGKFLHDIDIDWADGTKVAQKILPSTGFVYGRDSKFVSHCLYTANEAIPTYRYDDIDGTTLIEIRGTKNDGTLGFQSMVPPSMWVDKNDPRHKEQLKFRRHDTPAHLEAGQLRQSVALSAISMILSKYLGVFGFGHEPRLAWAGFMLKLGFTKDECQLMGEAISIYCQNTEVSDIRLVLESTAARLENAQVRSKGGPSLAKYLGDNGKRVLARIFEWLGRDSDFRRTKDGNIVKDDQENIKHAIEALEVRLAYNEFSDKLIVNGEPLEDRVLTALWLRVDTEFHFRPSFEFFDKVIRHLAWENGFHPVKEYLNTLTWDGEPRIDTWLIDYAGAEDNEYTRTVSAMVLVAAVRRIRSPGCKFDEMLVLESGQGMEKSSALSALCPKPEWFSDDLPLHVRSQQLIEGTIGKWIVEASDLAGKRKADSEQLKATLSRQVDGPARMAYARLPVERARQFIIIGTTNPAGGGYLADPTGARRFWPVRVKRFNVGKIRALRDQLWAEANAREDKGESIRLPEALWAIAGEQQDERREMDAWEEIIGELVENLPVSLNGRRKVTTNVIWDVLGIEVARRERSGSMRISEIMQRFGFTRTRVWEGSTQGKTVVGYEGPAPTGVLPLESKTEEREAKGETGNVQKEG